MGHGEGVNEKKNQLISAYSMDEDFLDFIIGIDNHGNKISHSCDPCTLDNYFGANPGAPHYLTQVFFDSAVLNKYYSNPEKYTVEDCLIRCGYQWTLEIDNLNTGYVIVYLGDLGSRLPSIEEQHYWRGFNIICNPGLSRTKFMRDFMALPADPQSLDFKFKNAYERVNKLAQSVLGWPMFLELDKQDTYNFYGLRIPLSNSIIEMDMLVLYLVKILIDSLNVKCINKQLTGTYDQLEGSISKLEIWLKEKTVPDYQEHIIFLRDLQTLRSSGTGHRKGKNYRKICNKLHIEKGNYIDGFSTILKKALNFLNFLESIIIRLTPDSS